MVQDRMNHLWAQRQTWELILSVCSTDQEATVSEQRDDGGEESDRGYMKAKRKCTKKSS